MGGERMNWHARLAERRGKKIEKGTGNTLTKPTKGASVSFGSDSTGRFQEIAPVETATILRAKLERLADTIAADLHLVHELPDDEIADCAGLPDAALRGYVLALRDSELRQRGCVPTDETARALCHSCGPVWAASEVAAAAPTVGGWARLLGCPWCHVRNRDAIPRPVVTCGDCAHFIHDQINLCGGMGGCAIGVNPDRPWPSVERQ